MASDHPNQPTRPWLVHLRALVIYTLGALFVTFPLITQLDSAFIANQYGQVDGFLSIWNLWWAAEALRTFQNPFHTRMLFHPQGLDLFWLWLSLPNGLLAAPITLLVGPLVAYNLTIIGSYLFGAYTAFLFVRHFVASEPAALVAGALYALMPFHMRRVLDAVMDTATIQWVPLYLLALFSLIERPRWWKVPLCGLLVLWVGLGSWYYGLFSLITTGMIALIWAFFHTPPADRQSLPNLLRWPLLRQLLGRVAWGISPMVMWLIFVAPQLIGLVRDGDRLLGVGLHANDSNSADLIDFFLPNPFHPLWGAALSAWYQQLRPEAWLWQVSFGWVALILALVAMRAEWRRLLPWILLLAATMLIAMGERLHVFGQTTSIPMPYALIGGLPGIRTSHRPNHILIISYLILALLAAYGVQVLIARMARVRSGWLLASGAMLAALLIDGWAGPLPLYRMPIPEGYARALPAYQADTGGALLPIPVNLNVARGEQLWYQTKHNWPIIGGYTGREPPYPLGKYAPGIRELRYGRSEPNDIMLPTWPAAGLDGLAAFGIRYIAFHPDLMKDSLERQRVLVGELGLQASYSDERLELYPVPERPLRVIGYLGDGWGGLEQRDGRRWRWLGAEPGELYLYNPFDSARSVTIDLHIEAFDRDRPLAISVDGMPPVVLQATRAEQRRSLTIFLTPGQHVVYFSAPADRPASGSGPLRSVSFLEIQVR
ncbi:MAG: hypothetical protein Fur005_35530 [Roseiflexaceae bacterium]